MKVYAIPPPADDTVTGENAKKAVAEMNDGEIVVLENTRFRNVEVHTDKNLFSFYVKVFHVFLVKLAHFVTFGPEAKFSLKPAAERLAELVKTKVVFAADDTVMKQSITTAKSGWHYFIILTEKSNYFKGFQEIFSDTLT